MENRYVATFSTGKNDYFVEAATAEMVMQQASSICNLSYAQSVQVPPMISSVDGDNKSPYQQSAHSVVIKRYAIKRT